MTSIKKTSKYNTEWYYKNTSTTNKPSDVAINTAKLNNNRVVVSRQILNNRLYASYETPEDVEKVIKEYGNIHLYEMITEDQPVNLFFDIEFPANQIDPEKALDTLIDYTRKVMIEVFSLPESFDYEDVSVSGSIGVGKIENVEVQKASYHIVIHCGSTFKNMKDLKTFMNYFKYRIDNDKPDNFFYVLKDNIKRIVDFQVYGKNQNMKLPMQSKQGSDRVQCPFDAFSVVHHFCGKYEHIDDFDIFDMTKIPKYELSQKTSSIKTVVGGSNDYVSSGNIHTDFVERQCIPKEDLDLTLEYIVNSIDNNGQDYNVWFGVACAIKNCKNKNGLKIFLKWASQSSKYDENECISLWGRISVREKGYNQGTLLLLAKRCNPKLIEKHELYLKLLTSTDTMFNIETYNEKWQRPYDLVKYKTIITQSPMGTGKTTQICETVKLMVANNPNIRIVVFSPRRCFAKSITAEITKKSGVNFTCYLDIEKKKDFSDIQFIVCQMESLHYLKSGYDMIIADEMTSCLTQFSSIETMKKKIQQVSSTFETIWKNAEYKIICDAFIDTKVIKFVESFDYLKKPDGIAGFFSNHNPYKNVVFMKNEYIPEIRRCVELRRYKENYDTIDLLQNKLINSLKNGKKCVFVTASKARGDEYLERIIKELPHIRYKFYNADNKRDVDDLLNVNEKWVELDLLLYTSSITVGVNFDIPHFDELFMYSSCKSSIVRDNFQSSMRSRHIKDNILYYQLFDKAFGLDADVVDEFDKVKAIIETKANKEIELENILLEEESDLTLTRWKEMPNWLMNIHLYNTYEKNISTLHHRVLFNYYLSRCNYKNFEIPTIEETPAELLPVSFTKYNDIHYTLNQAIYLEEKQINDRSNFTELEKNQYQKIMFDKQITDCSDRGEIYNFFFDPTQYNKNKYFNCLIEKRYDCHKLAIKERDENVFKELSQKKTQKLRCIHELLTILNITKSTAGITFTQEFLLSKYDQIMSRRKDWFSVFALRDQQKTIKGANMRQITNVINPILEKWSGSTLVMDGKLRKRVNGKITNVSNYKIFPPLGIDILGLFQN